MTHFKIALLQLDPTADQEENLAKGIKHCRKAKKLGADLALFPEMWQIGYEAENIRADLAIDQNHTFITSFQELAQELKMAIAITFLGKGSLNPTNSLMLIDMMGNIIINYNKVHTGIINSTESNLESGTSFQVASLSFEGGNVNLGAMISFDREFPESARSLMLLGAEIILTANSGLLQEDPTLGDVRLQQFRTRAFENMVGMALSNYPKPKNDGHSCAFDADGKPVLIANDEEGIFLATFDLEKIREWQSQAVWGAKFRHPECYENEVAELGYI
ncbi:MAG: carbon-nitrogen hydrolase family protein [Parachlamydiaceae bacterium]|nr:carbon-nitrogen hydrolase family protein [Parachlamydiaceae bacterium]